MARTALEIDTEIKYIQNKVLSDILYIILVLFFIILGCYIYYKIMASN